MAIKTLTINQIFKGVSPSQYFGAEGTYNASVAVDPDLPILSTDVRTSGFAVPVGYSVFSGANVTSHVVRIINNPKNTLTYAILSNGRIISYTSALGSETLVGTVSGGAAVWGEYYNNYIYIFKPTNVSRYGPLNNSPTLVDDVWTGATLGSLTALTNTTYPTLRSVSVPNHAAFVHGDGSMYFIDFINGQGLIHRITTRKVTDEGDTNGTVVASAYNVLDLPFGFYPTSITSFSTNLLITGIYTIDTTVNQGKSAFVIWDPTNTTSFTLGPVFLSDPLLTASLNVNGAVVLFSGNAQNGVRLSKYVGGESVQEMVFQEEGLPPFAGAVDSLGSRVVWGGFSTSPTTLNACVFAYGSKDSRLPVGLHNIIKTSSAGTTPTVTALKYSLQSSNVTPKPLVAWKDGTTQGIDQYSTTATLASKMRWMFNVGTKFNITRLSIPLAGAVGSTTTITPTLYFDDLSTPLVLTGINNTNYPAKRKVLYKGPELQGAIGQNNFVLELAWTGTNPLPVALPIGISIDLKEDEAS